MPNTSQIFEFSLYNEEVRSLFKMGERHARFDESWADQRYIQVRAENEELAAKEVRRRYPEAKGFVYTSVVRFME